MAGLALFAVAGCGAGRTNGGGSGAGLVVGTTDKIFSLDPAAA
jgi:peptide/nickel transport system substrate-binding protein